MPCQPYDGSCIQPEVVPGYHLPNIIPDPGRHYANPGYVGFVKLDISGSGASSNILRVTSADINLSQEITMPDVIDGRIDRTVYQLGPKIVEGSFSMPLVHDTGAAVGSGCPTKDQLRAASSLLNAVWCWCTARNSHGRPVYDRARMDIRYANHAAFVFDQCIANTFAMRVAHSDAVTLDIGVLGRGRRPATPGDNQNPTTGLPLASNPLDRPTISDFLSPARTVTWQDVTVNAVGGCGAFDGQPLFFSNQVREFSFDINNNADRFFTLQGSLFPVDINVAKREITGSLTMLGLADRLRVLAEDNSRWFTQKNEIRVAIYVGADTYLGSDSFGHRDWVDNAPSPENNYSSDLIWYKKLTGVIFEISTMGMTNDVFETEVNWHALGNDQTCYEAINPATSSFSNAGFPAWQ